LSEVNENFMECQCDNKVYSCTVEDILICKIANDVDTSVFTQTFSAYNSIVANFTRRVTPLSVAQAEIIYRNSTHVSSTLRVSGVHSLLGYYVACAGERIEIVIGDGDNSKQCLRNRLV